MMNKITTAINNGKKVAAATVRAAEKLVNPTSTCRYKGMKYEFIPALEKVEMIITGRGRRMIVSFKIDQFDELMCNLFLLKRGKTNVFKPVKAINCTGSYEEIVTEVTENGDRKRRTIINGNCAVTTVSGSDRNSLTLKFCDNKKQQAVWAEVYVPYDNSCRRLEQLFYDAYKNIEQIPSQEEMRAEIFEHHLNEILEDLRAGKVSAVDAAVKAADLKNHFPEDQVQQYQDEDELKSYLGRKVGECPNVVSMSDLEDRAKELGIS